MMKRRSKRSLLVGSLVMLFPIWSLADVTDATKAKIKAEESVVEKKQMKSSSFSGSGTEDDPFLIQSPEDLNQLRIEVNMGESFKDQHFLMTQDLDFEGFDDDGDMTNGNFTPIGTQETPFEGSLDGGGHILSNLNIKVSGSNLALFGYKTGGTVERLVLDKAEIRNSDGHRGASSLISVAQSVTIKEIGVVNSLIGGRTEGQTQTSGLVYKADDSIIENCYVEGRLTGQRVGGLVYELKDSSVRNSYVAISVNSYTDNDKKSVFYSGSNNQLSFIYRDSLLDNMDDEQSIPLTTEDFFEMNSQKGLDGFDYNLIWITYDKAKEWGSYPKFRWQGYKKAVVNTNYSGGNGLKNNPYQISKPEELNYLREQTNAGETYEGAYFAITQDLDFEGFNDDGNVSNGNFLPIGTEKNIFKGSIDGGGHILSNLNIKVSGQNLALIGYKTGGTIERLVLNQAKIKNSDGHRGTSSLISVAQSVVIKEVGVIDSLIGERNEGQVQTSGLIYSANDSIVENCYVRGGLTGQRVGGLVYELKDSSVRSSYVAISINSYTDDDKKSVFYSGSNNQLNYIYYDYVLSGISNDNQAIPLTTEEFKQKTLDQTLEGFDFENVWRSGKGYPQFIWEPKDNNIIINGAIEPTILNVSVPSQPISFALNPNQTPSFVAPTLTLASETVVPIQVSLQTFEQVGNVMTDVLPNRYADEEWQMLSKNDSKSWALGIKNLTTNQTAYVAGMNGLTPLGVVSQGSPLSFEFVAKHGSSFAEDLTLAYQLVFLFELLP